MPEPVLFTAGKAEVFSVKKDRNKSIYLLQIVAQYIDLMYLHAMKVRDLESKNETTGQIIERLEKMIVDQ